MEKAAYTLENQMLEFTENNTTIQVFPVLVESCMYPGTYRMYPVTVTIDSTQHTAIICSLQGTWEIDYNKTPIQSVAFTPKQPRRRGCDGNCDICRKCC